MLKISSRDNKKLKFARRVRDGFERDFIFIEGFRLAEESLRSNLIVPEVFLNEEFARSERGNAFLENGALQKTNLYIVADKMFASISDTKNSQGIVLISRKPKSGKLILENVLDKQSGNFRLLVLLHETNNPSNLGAVLRTCEAAGVSGVILTENSTDAFSPKALRASLGASLRVALWENAGFFEVLKWAKEKNLISICADVRAEKSYLEVDWKKPRLLIFGSEAHGLNEKERAAIEESLIVPMENGVESLNLAASCAVILFEAKRQVGEK